MKAARLFSRLLPCATCAAAFVFLAVRSISAHDAGVTSVVRVFVDEIGEHRYSLFTVDTGVPLIGDPKSVLPSQCSPLPDELRTATVGSGFMFECEHPLTFDDVITLPWNLGVVAVASWADGSDASAYFAPEGRTVPIRLAELRAVAGSRFRLAQRFTMLGFNHIVLGVDHLLFILGLFLLVRPGGPLVATTTAFALAQTATSAAVATGLVSVRKAPIEAAIALLFVLLAREVLVVRRGPLHLVQRWPWLVAMAFGLLHGFGFAGVVGQAGVRGDDLPAVLLFFALGAQLGQFLLVEWVLIANRAIRGSSQSVVPWIKPALGYSLGALATLWFFNWLPAVWGPL